MNGQSPALVGGRFTSWTSIFYGAGFVLIGLAMPAALSWGQELILTSPENAPTWEKEMAKGFLPYHHLVALDFPVKREGTGNVAFMLQPFMHCYYSIEVKGAANGFVYCYVANWKVFSGFDRNASWRNPKADMTAALPYAQALLDLAELRAREFGALKEGDLPSAQGMSLEEAHFICRMSLAPSTISTSGYAKRARAIRRSDKAGTRPAQGRPTGGGNSETITGNSGDQPASGDGRGGALNTAPR